jgi:DNA polymerase-1
MEKCRKKAKSVNFGIVYGISSKGLSDQLEVTEEEAQQYIDGFYATYPGVAKWTNDTKNEIRKNKFVMTLLVRKRRLYPEVDSGKWWKLNSAFRMGCNSKIQGSAADMSKKAAVDLQPLLKELDAKILLFIYDEFVLDVPEDIGYDNLLRIAKVMQNAIPLECGMTSDIEVGYRWDQKMTKEEIDELRQKYDAVNEEEENEEEEAVAI